MSRSSATITTAGSLPDLPQAVAPAFEAHSFEREFFVHAPRARVWAWLQDPATFTDSQIWPFRVEFVSANDDPPGFNVGGLNIHHGPFLHLPGQLMAIDEGHYRDLQYFYGSHAISPRLIRPTRLRFWLDDGRDAHASQGTRVRLQLDSFVRRGWAGAWTTLQRLFWARFPRWMTRAVTD